MDGDTLLIDDFSDSDTPARTTGVLNMLGAAAAGAAIMYFLDPHYGTRRQKRLRDRAVHLSHVTSEFAGTAKRDARNRARGLAANVRGVVRRDRADDRVVEERVRAEVGRLVSHPGAVEVAVEEGIAVLSGPVLRHEHDRLMSGVRGVRGVEAVEDHLDAHDTAADLPALQGPGRPVGRRFELAQENWSPAARMVTGVAGGALAIYGLRNHGLVPKIAAMSGFALLARAFTNRELDRITGVGGGRRSVDIQKTINIAAPLTDVFAFFTDWEGWPEWMTHVRSVSAPGSRGAIGERTHWVVDGPAGASLSWDAEVTEFVPNQLVSWRSVQGAAIRQAGTMHFDENEDGTTRVDIQMTYNPPGGAIGHAFAKVFARDPRNQMHADLARLKTTIETGTSPHDAAARV